MNTHRGRIKPAPSPARVWHKVQPRIHWWRELHKAGVLRSVLTSVGMRLLGGCTVVLVDNWRVIAETTADLPRPDVAEAMGADPRCGFSLEPPPTFPGQTVFRLIIMPERQELGAAHAC